MYVVDLEVYCSSIFIPKWTTQTLTQAAWATLLVFTIGGVREEAFGPPEFDSKMFLFPFPSPSASNRSQYQAGASQACDFSQRTLVLSLLSITVTY